MAPMLRSCSDQVMRVPGVILKTHLPSTEPDPVRRRALLRSGRIRAVAQWYVTDEAPQDLVDVLALHLRPTCLDAAALHGLWVPISEGTHVFGRGPSPCRRKHLPCCRSGAGSTHRAGSSSPCPHRPREDLTGSRSRSSSMLPGSGTGRVRTPYRTSASLSPMPHAACRFGTPRSSSNPL